MASKKAQTIVLILILFVVCGCATTSVKESPASDSIKVHSLWHGTYDQDGWIYPMILFIDSSTGNAFEGMTWYPTLKNGLCKVSGQIKSDDTITFTENEIIYDEDNIVIGCVYTASFDGNNIKGLSTRESREPHHFVLKLAD